MATTVTKVIDPDMGSGYDYDSLYDWEAAQQGDLTGARDEIAVAKCRCTGGTADSTAFEIDGWTTDSTRYIKVWTDPAESYRHNGTWQTGNKYRLIVSNANAIRISDNNVKIIGLQIQQTNPSTDGRVSVYVNALSEISYCVIRGNDSSTYWQWIVYTADAVTCKIWNNIIYDAGGNSSLETICVRNGATAYVYNNTIAISGSAGTLLRAVSSTIISKNNLLKTGSGECFGNVGGTLTNTNCASSDLTADDFGGSGNRVSQTFTFAGSSDFHLASTDGGAKGFGTNLYNDATCPFQDDIDGQDRGGSGATWDIGADQYALHKKWRTAATELALESAAWNEWPPDGVVNSLGFVQARLEALA